MDAHVEETGPVERRIRIEIPTVQVDATFDRVFQQLAKGARIKGFRPGKAPRSVLERYFGDEASQEVLQKLVEETLTKVVEEQDIQVVSEPRLQPEGQPRIGSPFVYEATVEVRPEIELKKVRGLEVQRPAAPQTEGGEGGEAGAGEDAGDPIEQHLESLRAAHAQLVSEPEGVRAARGHVVVVDFSGTLGDRKLEGGEGEGRELELGAGRAIPGFEEQLEGMGPGEEREFDLELPDTYPEDVAGRTAHFRVKLHEVKRKELPELDDEFAKDVSEFETLEALRADLRDRMEKARAAQEKQRLREATLEALVEANPFPVPESLIDRQVTSRLARAANELHGRIEEEELRGLIASWREEWRPQAERDVRLGLLLPEVANAESIEIGDEDVEVRLREIAKQSNEPITKVKRHYKEKGLMESLRAGLMEERVVEFLVTQATISDS